MKLCALDKLGHHATSANGTILAIDHLHGIIGTHPLVELDHLLVGDNVVSTAA